MINATMSEHDVKLFEAKYGVWKSEHGAGLTKSKSFERFTVEQILKDFDLDNDKIISGDLGDEVTGVLTPFIFLWVAN